MCLKLLAFKFSFNSQILFKRPQFFFLKVFVLTDKTLIFSFQLFFSISNQIIKNSTIIWYLKFKKISLLWRIVKMIKLNLLRGLYRDARWFIYFWLYLVPPGGNWNISRNFSGSWGVGWDTEYTGSDSRKHISFSFIALVPSREIGPEEHWSHRDSLWYHCDN